MEEQNYNKCTDCKEKGTACQTLKDVIYYNSSISAGSEYCPLSGKTEDDILRVQLDGVRADIDNVDRKIKVEIELAKQYEQQKLLEMFKQIKKRQLATQLA